MIATFPYRCVAHTLVGLCVAVSAGEPGPAIELHTIDGSTIRGQYQGVSNQGILRCRVNGTAQSIRLDEIHRMVFDTPSDLTDRPDGASIFHLADGGQFAGTIVGSADGGITVQTSFAESLVIGFDHLAAIRFPFDPDLPRVAEAFESERADRLAGHDVLIARADDDVRTVRGTVVSLGPTEGRFVFNGKERAFAVSSTYGLVFAVGSGSTQPGPAHLRLADGTRLSGRLLPSQGRSVTVETTFGSRLELSPNMVVEITLTSGRVVYLSDTQPIRQDVRGLLHAPWPVRRDASATNQPIRLDGRVFEKGLGVHARTELVYALDGSFERFCTTIGIDDAVRPRGQVVFRVLGDGRVLADSGPVTGRDTARDLTIEIDGVKELTLIVDYGDGMDLADHADWADARLIRPAN